MANEDARVESLVEAKVEALGALESVHDQPRRVCPVDERVDSARRGRRVCRHPDKVAEHGRELQRHDALDRRVPLLLGHDEARKRADGGGGEAGEHPQRAQPHPPPKVGAPQPVLRTQHGRDAHVVPAQPGGLRFRRVPVAAALVAVVVAVGDEHVRGSRARGEHAKHVLCGRQRHGGAERQRRSEHKIRGRDNVPETGPVKPAHERPTIGRSGQASEKIWRPYLGSVGACLR
mmetsp:Transcript_23837/g.52120  ORF Transcript_23837/g.52120 Transcript_23837/m.52120 type:complete len:233 (-) Transcript_23837:388-1086(-)